MKSIEMFKELGYEQIQNDENYIIYEKHEKKHTKREILFSIDSKCCKFYFEDKIRRPEHPVITMELFKAIQQQLLELGWVA